MEGNLLNLSFEQSVQGWMIESLYACVRRLVLVLDARIGLEGLRNWKEWELESKIEREKGVKEWKRWKEWNEVEKQLLSKSIFPFNTLSKINIQSRLQLLQTQQTSKLEDWIIHLIQDGSQIRWTIHWESRKWNPEDCKGTCIVSTQQPWRATQKTRRLWGSVGSAACRLKEQTRRMGPVEDGSK